MSTVKLQAAREYIQEQRYDDAARLLRGIDHPTARRWLARIDAIQAARKPRGMRLKLALLGAGILFLLGTALYLNIDANRAHAAFVTRSQQMCSENRARGFVVDERTAQLYGCNVH